MLASVPREVIAIITDYSNDTEKLVLHYTSLLFRALYNIDKLNPMIGDLPFIEDMILLFIKITTMEQAINGSVALVTNDVKDSLLLFLRNYEKKYRYSGKLTNGLLTAKLFSLIRRGDKEKQAIRKIIKENVFFWYNFACE